MTVPLRKRPETEAEGRPPGRSADGEPSPVDQLRSVRQVLADQFEEIDRLSRLLKDRTDQLEQFAQVASHDLKAPLRRVSLYASRLVSQLGDDLPEEAKRSVEGIDRAVQRMRSLIDDLLDFSQVGTREMEWQDVDMTQCTRRVVDDLEADIQETDAQVDIAPLPDAYGDAAQLHQLLVNLIGNALKYRSEAPPKIQVRGGPVGKVVRIEVRDNGIGIPPEHHDKVFDIFTRLQVQDEQEGNGVGLAICKRIIERHGGQIGVESVPGEGSTFWFEVPGAVDATRGS